MKRNIDVMEVGMDDFLNALINACVIDAMYSDRRRHACPSNTSRQCNRTEKCNKENTSTKAEDVQPKLSDFIDRVIAQDTAVVVFWKDGTKTSVKANVEDKFDYEKGIAMATLKYIFGNKYYEDMKSIIANYPHVSTANTTGIECKNNEVDQLTDKTIEKTDEKKGNKSADKKTVSKKSESNVDDKAKKKTAAKKDKK